MAGRPPKVKPEQEQQSNIKPVEPTIKTVTRAVPITRDAPPSTPSTNVFLVNKRTGGRLYCAKSYAERKVRRNPNEYSIEQ